MKDWFEAKDKNGNTYKTKIIRSDKEGILYEIWVYDETLYNFTKTEKTLDSILNTILTMLLLVSIVCSSIIFMVLEFGINDAITLIDHRGLFNYSLLVTIIASMGVVINIMNKVDKK